MVGANRWWRMVVSTVALQELDGEWGIYNRNASAQLSSEGRPVVKCSKYLAMLPPVRVARFARGPRAVAPTLSHLVARQILTYVSCIAQPLQRTPIARE